MAHKKREQWYQLMQEYERSGKSVATWCAETGHAYHTFHYWRYRAKIQDSYRNNEATTPTAWIKATLKTIPRNNEIKISIGSVEIIVAPGFDQELLREITECLS